MKETNTTAASQHVFEELDKGTPLSLPVTMNATSDSSGVPFTEQVEAPSQTIPIPRIMPVPPPLPPIAPPVSTTPIVPVPVASRPQFASIAHPRAIPSTLKTAFPHPTNAWWENIILGKDRVAPDPYQIQVVDNGFLACYPTQIFTQDSFGMQHITTQWLQNFSLEFAEHMGRWAVTRYDDLTVALKWIAANGQGATSVIAQGCPYLSMSYSGTTPLLTTQHVIASMNGFTTPGTYTGNKFKISLNNGQTWLLYCSRSLSFTWTNGQLLASAPFTGTIRLALTSSDEALLDQYVSAIPTSGTVSTAYTGGNATYTFTWTVAGTGPLLMCALPHHMDILQSPQTVQLTRQSIKGTMTGVVGNTWTLLETLPKIQWTASKSINPQYRAAIAAQLKKDAGFINNSTSDTYFASKGLAKMARLLLIAEEVGDSDSVALIQKNLKASLATWLDGNLFRYDKTWGSLMFASAGTDPGADFGFNWKNDGHYHMGYMVYACAVLARFDASWLAIYKEKVTELLHHYCNPDTSDTRYTPYRYKDMWAGHSWASGLISFADNRNQESTSEAINAYYAMMLWGLVTGDTTTQNVGSMMLASEARSARKYWCVYPNNNPYAAMGYTSTGVGLVWQAGKIDDSTWFDAHLSCRRGIQMIPISPVTEMTLTPAWVNAMKASGELDKMVSENFQSWPTFVVSALAVIDQATAWTAINALADKQIDDGTSRTNLLYFVATR